MAEPRRFDAGGRNVTPVLIAPLAKVTAARTLKPHEWD